MPTFLPLPEDIEGIVLSVLDEHFPKLLLAEPPIRFAWLGATGLTRHGCDVAWKTRVTKDEERAAAPPGPDVVVAIGLGEWRSHESNPETQRAIAAEALHSIVPQWAKVTSHEVKTDGNGRPKIKLRGFDVMLCGYKATVQTFGRHAPLHHAVQAAAEALRQLALPFDDRVQDVERETFAALLSVGHTAEQARAAMERTAGGGPFTSVSAWVDAVYRESVAVHAPAEPAKAKRGRKPKASAEARP